MPHAKEDATIRAPTSQPKDRIGLVVVDHGSRREESNAMLLEMVEMVREAVAYSIVEPAHMELAEPSIATAFDRCITQGADSVVISPYFLLPGRHWNQDIPHLAAEAAAKHPGVKYLVSAPLGLHPLMAEVVGSRVDHCLKRAAGDVEECEACEGTGRCRFDSAGAPAA